MSALAKLRDYQVKTIKAIHEDWDTGMWRPASVLATGAGKGHPLWTMVPTPNGLRRWGDLKTGDLVFGSDGRPTAVTDVFDRGELPTYLVTLSDGSSVTVDGEHLWNVRDYRRRTTKREFRTLSTQTLLSEGLKLDRGYRFRIPVARPVAMPHVSELPIHPYVVGALIANGGLAHDGTVLTTPDSHVSGRVSCWTTVNRVADTTPGVCPRFSLPGLTRATRNIGMRVKSGEKRIPAIYLNTSIQQRIDLLHGLMDGDGSMRDTSRRSVQYSTTSPGLADDVRQLVSSLGGSANVRSARREGKAAEYTIGIMMPENIPAFSTPAKLGSGDTAERRRVPVRSIVSIEPAPPEFIRCITVAAADSLYLITRNHIVTHNTVVFSHLADEYLRANPGKRVLILSHTDELVNQAAHKMSMVNPDRKIGIVKAAQNEVHAEIISASVQSLRSVARRNKIRNVGLIVVDECFPAGTLVGGRPIEDLRPGDLVPSWDERTGREVMAPVVAPMSRIPSGMVRVTMETGQVIHCTPNHPFLTTEGWCSAELLHGASVISFTHDAKASEDSSAGTLYGVRRPDGIDRKGSRGRLSPEWSDVLPDRVPGRLGESGLFGQDGSDEPSPRLVTHEGAQPDEVRGEPREDEGDSRGDRASTTSAWREREAGTRAAAASRRVPGVAGGGDRGSGRRADALALQAGHRAPDDEGLRGSGRGIPLLAGAPSLRPEAGRAAVATRVANVQVLEPGRDGTYGGVCPDGLVYNVEVAGTHTYLIEGGVVVHNCHHATARTYQTILQHFGAINADGEPVACGTACRPGWHGHPIAAGFTATLVRGDKAKLSDVWQSVAIRISIAFLIRAGYLLDVKGKRVEVPDLNLKEVKQSGGDYQEGALGEALVEAMAPEIVAKAFIEHAAGRKGLIFAPTVDSAYAFAEAFNAQGIVTEVVHGGLGRDERRGILARLKSGETQVVSNCMVLTEGFDEPTVSCAVIARPTKSSGLYQQMVGRVLRPDLSLKPGDRGHALILDVVGVSRMHGLQSLVDLSTRDDLPEDVSEDLSLLELEDLLLDEEEVETEGGGDRPEVWYAGPAETRDFDPLGADSKRTWGKTDEGTYWLSAGTEGYVFLADSISGEPGTYDVVWCAKTVQRGQHYAAAAMTEHTGLPFEMALAWAEEEASERGGFGTQTLTTKKARWRKDPATAPALKLAQRFGHFRDAVWSGGSEGDVFTPARPDLPHTPDGELITKGQVAEVIDAGTAARVIDPLVAFVKKRGK